MIDDVNYEAPVEKDPNAQRTAWLSIFCIEALLLAALIWTWW